VTVDGQTQHYSYGPDDAVAEAGTGGICHLSHLGGDVQMVEALADSAYYSGGIYRRAIVTVGADYAVDFFWVRMPGEHVFDYALHGAGCLSLDCPTQPARALLRPTAQQPPSRAANELPWQDGTWSAGQMRFRALDVHAAYEYAHEVYACEPTDTVCATFHGGLWADGQFLTGGTGLKVYVLPEPQTRLFACKTPRRQGRSAGYGPTLIVRRVSSETVFANVLAPFRQSIADTRTWGLYAQKAAGAPSDLSTVTCVHGLDLGGRAHGVEVASGAGTDLVMHTFQSSAQAIAREHDVAFGGKFCWLRFDWKGRLAAAEVARGLRLEVKGKVLYAGKDGQPGDWSWRRKA
jgi:hypothetical protein